MRTNRVNRMTVTLVALMAVFAATATVAQDTEYSIMRPDEETLQRWLADYANAPESTLVSPPGREARAEYSVLHHVDYVAADRNQASCGNCWAWAGTGCAEVAHDVENGVFDRLSIQLLNSGYNGGSGAGYACCGGWLSDFAAYYAGVTYMIPWSNTNAHWQDGGTACAGGTGSTTVASGDISTAPNYGITSISHVGITTHGVEQAAAIANIKAVLHNEEAVWFAFFLADFTPFRSFWNNDPPTADWDFDPHMGGPYEGPNRGGHAVLCVGYNDDDPGNAYWVMLNSWGTAGGSRPDGLFRVEMDMDYSGKLTGLGGDDYALFWQYLEIDFGNTAPECDANGPYEAECAGRYTDVQLDGSQSSDPDEDALTYTWTTDCPEGSFDDENDATPVLTLNSALNVTCDVTLEVSDGDLSDTCSSTVTITDTLPPVVSGFTLTTEDVDEGCEATVTFSAMVDDICCQGPSGIDVSAEVLTGNAVIAPWSPSITPLGGNQFAVSGTLAVSDLTGCPVQIRVTIGATDCNDNAAIPATGVAIVNDNIPPVITANAVGGEVDEDCEYLMPFSGTVTDNCCVTPDDVMVAVSLLTGNAVLGSPTINKMQVGPSQVDVVGAVLVSDLTSCPATVQVVIDADDCCENPGATATATADVVDLIPPEIVCPEPITLERGDKICNDDVQNWLDSTTATDNCDPDVDIVDDSAANGFECGFPYDSTTTVTWTATDDCGNTSECSSTITIKPAKRVSATKKGSLLIYPKVELKWNAAGALTQDTFVTITNDYLDDVFIHWYFVNGDEPLDEVLAGDPPTVVEPAHPGCNWVNCTTYLTHNEPTYFSASTGLPAGCQPFATLDNAGGVLGRPDPEGDPGTRVLRGYMLAYAMDNFGNEITWNHLSGTTTIVNYADTSAWEYGAYAFQATCGELGDEPLDCTLFDANGTCCEAEAIPGRLDMDGFQYDIAFDKLLLDFYAVGSEAFADGGIGVMLDTDLTLLPIMIDVRQDSDPPVTTKAHFDIWNANEDGFSGTIRCLTCWDQTLLSNYELPNQFKINIIHTDKGKARIDGIYSTACDESVDAPLLGVAAKVLSFSGTARDRAYSGLTLVGQGEEAGYLLADIIEPSDTLMGPERNVRPTRKVDRSLGD